MDDAEVKAKALSILSQKDLPIVLSTVDADSRPHSRYMGSGIPVEGEDFDFYMVSGASSRKVAQLAANPRAQILAAAPEWAATVSLAGTASLVEDTSVKDMVWDSNPVVHQFFEGKQDANFAVIRFRGEELEYATMAGEPQPYIVKV